LLDLLEALFDLLLLEPFEDLAFFELLLLDSLEPLLSDLAIM
jgi:hypothetical protein